jgi:hypothetical protein
MRHSRTAFFAADNANHVVEKAGISGWGKNMSAQARQKSAKRKMMGRNRGIRLVGGIRIWILLYTRYLSTVNRFEALHGPARVKNLWKPAKESFSARIWPECSGWA